MQYHSKINIYFYFSFFLLLIFFFIWLFFIFICKWKTIMPLFRKEQQSLFVWDLGNGKWLIPQDVQCFLLNALRSLWSGWKLTLWRPYVGLDSLLPDLQTSWKGIQRNAALVIAKGTDMRRDWRNYSDYIWVLWEVMGSSYHASGKKKSDTGCFMRADSLFGEARWGSFF